MTNMEVVVEGNCYVSGRMERCCIGIENGRIQKVAKLIEGEKVFRFGTKIVPPAAPHLRVTRSTARGSA